ncbi:hypothetical protein SAMN05216559_1819 [Halomicrobium zhouii]|uniref:HNH endonuclease n=1 Tax=Halomicrobium zhouii TaxID=767519 RepID=A0A1I6L1E3_9EURY|nr:HNH endonuclease [Halomicrobium zhouii]SFR97261.1 hypothetical protein SAMN05216559_1819 [Halomicrobium zhouii]
MKVANQFAVLTNGCFSGKGVEQIGFQQSRSIVYIRRFGCWNDALQEIGLTPNRPGSISKEQLLTELKRVAEDLGKTPTREEFDACSRYSAGTYYGQFKGWNEALKTVGLEPNRHCNVDKEELIQELNRLNDTLGHAPTITDAAKEGRYGTATFERTFGSWNNALKAAGFDVHNRSGIEEEELIDELHRLKENLGKPPTVCQNREHGQFSLGAYQRVFGTWNNAIQAAELDRNHRLAIPRTELLDELTRLAADLGKAPTVAEMDAHGEFSRRPYQQEFGGWRKALAATGFSPSETRRLTDHPIYGIGWTKKRRKRVRNRNGHICVICGVTQSEHLEKNDTRLHVHHICGARESTNPAVFNADRNLLTVCADCHKTIEYHVPGLPPNVLQPSRSLNSD